MRTRRSVPHALTVLSILSCFLNASPETLAQDRGKSLENEMVRSVGNEFIPTDAIAVAVINVFDIVTEPECGMYPIEIMEAWCLQNTGISAQMIDTVKVVAALGPDGPKVAAVVRLQQAFDPSKLNPDLVPTDDPIHVDGHACFPVNAHLPMLLHQLDPTTIVVATANYLDAVLRAGEEDRVLGSLAELADGILAFGKVSCLATMEPIRPLVAEFLQSEASEIQAFSDSEQITELLDAIAIQLDLTSGKTAYSLNLIAVDDDSAKKLDVIYRNAVSEMVCKIVMPDMEVEEEDPVIIASKHYMERMAERIVKHLAPERSGHHLDISGTLPENMTSMSGSLTGILVSSLQAKRGTSHRATPLNHGQSIVIAFHNHHDVYQFLPGNILGKDGEPLLSWRVAILPFVEEYELYERFHLDEPWNSEHNIKLVDEMPSVYRQPFRDLPAGKTVYQRPSGTQLIMHPGSQVRFQDILDGMSNTIILAEVMPDQAVDWSKPEDLKVDLTDPKKGLSANSRKKTLCIMADGAGLYLPSNIPAGTLKKLLTHASGETVDTSGF